MPVGMERERGHLHGTSRASVYEKRKGDVRLHSSGCRKVEEGGLCMDRGPVRSNRLDGLAACDVLHGQSRSGSLTPSLLATVGRAVDVDDAQSPALWLEKCRCVDAATQLCPLRACRAPRCYLGEQQNQGRRAQALRTTPPSQDKAQHCLGASQKTRWIAHRASV